MTRILFVAIVLALVSLPFLPVQNSFAGAGPPAVHVTLARQPAQRAGAVSNATPLLTPPSDMNVAEGSEAEQALSATDDDGQSLRFFKIEGPDFFSVSTTSPGTGTATGRIRLRPGFIDAGVASGTVGVSDGIDGVRDRFSMTVTDVPRSASAGWAELDSSSFSTAEDPGHTLMADLDGDGIDDLVVGHINTGSVSVYVGDGGGTFHLKANYPSVMRSMTSISIGDFTGDSRLDLVVTYTSGRLLAGNGDGTFQTPSAFQTSLQPYSSDSGDLNGDGVADLVIGDNASGTVSVYLADGTGQFAPRVPYSAGVLPNNVELVDLDQDGDLDIAVANLAGTVSVLLGNGAGSFGAMQTYPAAPIPGDLAVGDLNGDHLPDIVTAAYGQDSVSVLLNAGAGTFQDGGGFHTGHAGTVFAIRDFNADGRGDLAMAVIGGVLIFPGNGNGTFGSGFLTAPGAGGGLGVAIDATAIDLNADGAADLVIPDRATTRIRVVLSDPRAGSELAARAFLSKPGPIQTGGGGPAFTCVQVEPVAGSYENGSVDRPAFAMTSTGTGAVHRIAAASATAGGDTDRNGVPEIQVCFSRDELQRIFSGTRGKVTAEVGIEGALTDGRSLHAALEVNLKGHEARPAQVRPNPSNPTAVLTFDTEAEGMVRVRLFDLSGRLVRTVLEAPRLGAGSHSLPIDGRDGAGTRLSSGIFFYQIESPQRVERGRVVILK